MASDFQVFGPLHFSILAATVAVPYALSRLPRVKSTRLALGVVLGINEAIWYAYRFLVEGYKFPEGIPLQLCDAAVILTVWAALTGSNRAFELAYYWGLAGAGMALLTPDLWAPCWSYPTMYFWLAHSGMVAILLLMLFAGHARPREGSVWRALIAVNIFAAFAGLFNWIFKTNYMYLCKKPAAGSLLDALGPWPWYLAGGEVLALLFFGLLWLPFAWRKTA
jgi:hypothetical integral membrane protein (TIGR02206 family)